MQYRTLGRTGLSVSEISLGTVQFGVAYGLPDEKGRLPQLSEPESMEILRRAISLGLNFLDTARSYGISESVIARALQRQPADIMIATKLAPLSEEMTDEELYKAAKASIEESRRTLDRESLDLLQVHNATHALMARDILTDVLMEARDKERVRFLGVSTYGLRDPEFALGQDHWDTLQMEFNLLNQQARQLFDEIQKQNRGLIIRSAMLKGLVTADPDTVPQALRPAAQKARDIQRFSPHHQASLPQTALNFVLSHPAVSTVLTGVQTPAQLVENAAAVELPLWSADHLSEAQAFDMGETLATDPRQWGF